MSVWRTCQIYPIQLQMNVALHSFYATLAVMNFSPSASSKASCCLNSVSFSVLDCHIRGLELLSKAARSTCGLDHFLLCCTQSSPLLWNSQFQRESSQCQKPVVVSLKWVRDQSTNNAKAFSTRYHRDPFKKPHWKQAGITVAGLNILQLYAVWIHKK